MSACSARVRRISTVYGDGKPESRRIAIARALAVQPRVIVCDEPTSALDVSMLAQILNLLRELQRAPGVSFLFINHDIAVVETIADRVAVMQDRAIVEQGRLTDLLNLPQQGCTRSLLAACRGCSRRRLRAWRAPTAPGLPPHRTVEVRRYEIIGARLSRVMESCCCADPTDIVAVCRIGAPAGYIRGVPHDAKHAI